MATKRVSVGRHRRQDHFDTPCNIYLVNNDDKNRLLGNADERFDWIGKVPISALRILREENKLDYMWSVIRKGITDLKTRRDKDLIEVSVQIERNSYYNWRFSCWFYSIFGERHIDTYGRKGYS